MKSLAYPGVAVIRRMSVPSGRMRYTPRSWSKAPALNAISDPSGDQAGCPALIAGSPTGTDPWPSAPATKIRDWLTSDTEYAIERPSGDHATAGPSS